MTNEDTNIQLASFVGKNSWLPFQLFSINTPWLQMNPAIWETQPEYKKFSTKIKNIAVTRDSAERTIRDMQKFADFSKDSKTRGKILSVVDWHRSECPSINKKF